jgi:hypothetical protein
MIPSFMIFMIFISFYLGSLVKSLYARIVLDLSIDDPFTTPLFFTLGRFELRPLGMKVFRLI